MGLREFIHEYLTMSRYIALGTLDGILAVMGVTLTASGVAGIGGVEIENYLIGLTGLSGGIALAMSNAFGSFIGERAEETRTMRELEKKMIMEKGSLNDTIIHQQAKRRIYMSMFTHGFSSFLGAFVPTIPFFFIKDRITATILTILLSMIALIILGVYLGIISRENIFKTSIEIVAIGLMITFISIFLGGSH
ncbi:MAG: TIGR00267 family protein [Methanothermobacter sp.]